jgi:hypothetical protein
MVDELRTSQDGILRTSHSGEMTKEDVDVILKKATAALELATEEKPLLVLMDARQTGKFSATARKAFAQLDRDPRVGKVAVVGLGRYMRIAVSFINKAAGREHIRFFESEEQALAWLKSDDK